MERGSMKKIGEADLESKISALGEAILQKERECLCLLGRGLTKENSTPGYEDQYYNRVEHNLWAGYIKDGKSVKYPHFDEYSRGSGGELIDARTPAKMKSIRSSSAMTYNLLGNHQIELIGPSERLSKGLYKVEYEKQLYTLRNNLQPANLDAYLYQEAADEAIFCEMKMMEWIFNPPNGLKEAYLDLKNYFGFDTEAKESISHTAFINMIHMLKKEMPTYLETVKYEPMMAAGKPVLNRNGKPRKVGIKGEVHRFFRYDAWQMYKHTLGIYNMTSQKTKNEIVSLTRKSAVQTKQTVKMLPNLKKVTLVNVVFEPGRNLFMGELKDYYEALLEKEHKDFETFRDCLHKSGVIDAFREDCGIDFDVLYMSAREFSDCFAVGERRAYLERYCLE